MPNFDMSTWQFWLIVAAIISLLYIARPYLHRFLRSIFFGIAYYFNRLSVWLANSGQVMFERYCETVAAHRAETYEDKLYGHQHKLGKRAMSHDTGVMAVVGKLEVSSQEIEGAVSNLSHINMPDAAVQAVRQSMNFEDGARAQARLSKSVTAVKQVLSAKVQEIRPDLNKIRTEMPLLRQNIEKLTSVEQSLNRLSSKINADFKLFEDAVHSPDRIAVASKQSIVIPWLLSLLVMTIALTGVFLNFFLIQRPMAEIVGDDIRVIGMSLPTAAAIVVIFLEAVTGIVLMEAAGITNLMNISHLGERTKKTLFFAAIAFLVGFSFFEAALAVQRDVLINLDLQTQSMALGDTAEVQSGGLSLTMVAQVVLAILIPWLLAIAAIPLETVIQNFWFIVRLVAHQVLIFMSILFRALSTLSKSVGVFLLRLYDLVIFLPLAIEQMVRSFNRRSRSSAK